MWIPMYATIAIFGFPAAAVAVWQYARRHTTAARTVMGAGVAVCGVMWLLPPSGLAAAIYTSVLGAPQPFENVRLRFTMVSPVKAPSWDERHGDLSLNVRADGVPEGMTVSPDIERLEIESPAGKWSSGWTVLHWATIREWRENSMSFLVKPKEIGNVAGQPATIRLSMVLTVMGPERAQTVGLHAGPAQIEGVGVCRLGNTWQGHVVNCTRWAPPEVQVYVSEIDYAFYLWPDWPLPVTTGPSPVWTISRELTSAQPGGPVRRDEPVTIRTRKPVARLRRELVVENIRLTDYR
jgi:hypothetical protein